MTVRKAQASADSTPLRERLSQLAAEHRVDVLEASRATMRRAAEYRAAATKARGRSLTADEMDLVTLASAIAHQVAEEDRPQVSRSLHLHSSIADLDARLGMVPDPLLTSDGGDTKDGA